MTPEDQKRIARLVEQIQTESDPQKLLTLMEELNEFLCEREAQTAVLRAGKTTSQQGRGRDDTDRRTSTGSG